MTDDLDRDEEATMAVTDLHAAPDPMTQPPHPRSSGAAGPDDALTPGTRVEVRTRLDSHRWGRGFVVAAVEADGYVLTRDSDGSTMPVTFPFDDVRPERKRGTWWY